MSPKPLPAPGEPGAPNYWMQEVGILPGIVKKYLASKNLAAHEVMLMKKYVCQWLYASAWDQNPHADARSRADLAELRADADAIRTQIDLNRIIYRATRQGMDPL